MNKLSVKRRNSRVGWEMIDYRKLNRSIKERRRKKQLSIKVFEIDSIENILHKTNECFNKFKSFDRSKSCNQFAERPIIPLWYQFWCKDHAPLILFSRKKSTGKSPNVKKTCVLQDEWILASWWKDNRSSTNVEQRPVKGQKTEVGKSRVGGGRRTQSYWTDRKIVFEKKRKLNKSWKEGSQEALSVCLSKHTRTAELTDWLNGRLSPTHLLPQGRHHRWGQAKEEEEEKDEEEKMEEKSRDEYRLQINRHTIRNMNNYRKWAESTLACMVKRERAIITTKWISDRTWPSV